MADTNAMLPRLHPCCVMPWGLLGSFIGRLSAFLSVKHMVSRSALPSLAHPSNICFLSPASPITLTPTLPSQDMQEESVSKGASGPAPGLLWGELAKLGDKLGEALEADWAAAEEGLTTTGRAKRQGGQARLLPRPEHPGVRALRVGLGCRAVIVWAWVGVVGQM